MFEDTKKRVIDIYQQVEALNEQIVSLWREEILFTWRWWIVVATLVLPWILWFILRKRESTDRLLYAGLSVYTVTSLLNAAGVPFGLWCYIVTPLPYLHSFYVPWDLSVFPVTIMLMIQYKRHVSPYVKAAIFALMSSFVAEPLFKWLGIYHPISWKHYYGVPFYYLIYLMAHYISQRKKFAEV